MKKLIIAVIAVLMLAACSDKGGLSEASVGAGRYTQAEEQTVM